MGVKKSANAEMTMNRRGMETIRVPVEDGSQETGRMAIAGCRTGPVPSLLAPVSMALFRHGETLTVRAEIRRDEQPKILPLFSFRVLVVTDPLSRFTSAERA